nr:hypothetical protein [Ningiella sp. W23]
MFKSKPISQIIIKVYLLGALILLAFYGCLFYYTVLYTENQASEQRLALKAPYHLKLFQKSENTKIKIDPILTIYNTYEILPKKLKIKLTPTGWVSKVFILMTTVNSLYLRKK